MLSAACPFRGCSPASLLSGQLTPFPYFCFPLCTASSLVLFLHMLSFSFLLLTSTSLLVFAAAFVTVLLNCCNSTNTASCPALCMAVLLGPLPLHTARTLLSPVLWLLTSQCAPPGCSCFSVGIALPSSLQLALCTVLPDAFS